MARRVADAAEGAGAEVRVRHVAETRDPESFAQNPAWTANYEATKDLPAAAGDDIVWADAVIFGSPTRFGSPSSQFRTFIDSLGGLWSQGKLADKVYAGFTSSQTAHGRAGDHTARPLHHADAFRRHHCAARIHRRPEVRRWQPIRGQPHHRAGDTFEINDATAAALDHLARRVVSTCGSSCGFRSRKCVTIPIVAPTSSFACRTGGILSKLPDRAGPHRNTERRPLQMRSPCQLPD